MVDTDIIKDNLQKMDNKLMQLKTISEDLSSIKGFFANLGDMQVQLEEEYISMKMHFDEVLNGCMTLNSLISQKLATEYDDVYSNLAKGFEEAMNVLMSSIDSLY
ncbi:MAG: hypothetical protein IJO63_02580 [Bacilli bacterium]|nr:hypothetical protein [Bacilli bacterium]